MARQQRRRKAADGEDVAARAARLGISEERILREYARIAFSNILRIARWDDGGLLSATPVGELSEDDATAIAEIVASAKELKVYRIKMHPKEPVLGALGRYLNMFPPLKTQPHEDEELDGEDPRERLIRELDALEAEAAAQPGDPQAGA
ncbi:MAG TPA: hypothetical protein VE993_04715 [Stellaceae bacterium]|nr:hypothetical protein [Stellaceae bacterium]